VVLQVGKRMLSKRAEIFPRFGNFSGAGGCKFFRHGLTVLWRGSWELGCSLFSPVFNPDLPQIGTGGR